MNSPAYKAHRIAARAEEARINLRIIDNNTLGIALDQSSSRKLIRQLWKILARRAMLPHEIQGLLSP